MSCYIYHIILGKCQIHQGTIFHQTTETPEHIPSFRDVKVNYPELTNVKIIICLSILSFIQAQKFPHFVFPYFLNLPPVNFMDHPPSFLLILKYKIRCKTVVLWSILSIPHSDEILLSGNYHYFGSNKLFISCFFLG